MAFVVKLALFSLFIILLLTGQAFAQDATQVSVSTDKPIMVSKDLGLSTLKNADNNFVYQ